MKKSYFLIFNIIAIFSIAACLFLPIQRSYADALTPDSYIDSGGPISNSQSDIEENFIRKYGGRIYRALYIIAIIAAIFSLLYVGFVYITAGVNGKADYKKTLIPIFIGIGFIVFLASILRAIIAFASAI